VTGTALREASSRSVLTPLLNLQCEAGHFHFSPTPLAFVGGLCTASTKPGSCRAALLAYSNPEPPRNSGEAAGVDGPTALGERGDALE
jgi:hypothetical protein